jgi:hypothetical protein
VPHAFQLRLLAVIIAISGAAVSAAEFTPFVHQEPAAVASAPSAPARARAISPELAAKLSSSLPFYLARTPLPAAPPAAALAAESIDVPANGIIRLPRLVVQEKRLAPIAERDLLTSRGGSELASKRHPGLKFPGNSIWAEALLEEEFAIERQREMYELLGPAGGRPPIFTGRPPWKLPVHASGPEKGLVVPWERR